MRKTALALAIIMIALLTGVANATDNNTPQHWHDYQLITWDYRAWSSDYWWEYNVEFAFDTWELYSVVDFTKVTSSSDIEVYRGVREDSGCAGQTAIACSHQYWWLATNHIYDANVFLILYDVDWDEGVCNPGPAEYPRYSVAMHEIGHAAGQLNGYPHTSDSAAIMYATFNKGVCKNLQTHDINSMDAQYASH